MTEPRTPTYEALEAHCNQLKERVANLEFGIENVIEMYAEDMIDTKPLRLVLQGRSLDDYNQAHQS